MEVCKTVSDLVRKELPKICDLVHQVQFPPPSCYGTSSPLHLLALCEARQNILWTVRNTMTVTLVGEVNCFSTSRATTRIDVLPFVPYVICEATKMGGAMATTMHDFATGVLVVFVCTHLSNITDISRSRQSACCTTLRLSIYRVS